MLIESSMGSSLGSPSGFPSESPLGAAGLSGLASSVGVAGTLAATRIANALKSPERDTPVRAIDGPVIAAGKVRVAVSPSPEGSVKLTGFENT